ncbi:MAG: DNA-protecting protein DprA [Proteobacteria bacterium]|uniref:DNA-processing protein DprA n=1 Tax=Aquabacterium sp. TaxID=1872578 RepID=UPI0035C66274|nr:DNA-protecting protein DprA [Pseudomonadota bacterium]
MDHPELAAWLRLLMTPGVGPLSARRLLAAFGSPQAIFDASPAARRAVLGRGDAAALGATPDGLTDQAEQSWQWLRGQTAEACGPRAILTLADPRYPAALLDATDPPLLLFAEGDLRLLRTPAVAIVGSRHATAQGEDNARAFAEALSRAGVTVVSGLARGIDAAAHDGALRSLGGGPAPQAGSTIAVLGTGLQHIYPKGHTALAQRIARQGLLLSEFLLDTPPLRNNFPKRNRIVAALSRGTLVVEAAVQSGSLITARLAAELGREVLAIPGSIHAPQSRGCHALIKQGAKLVETAADVLEELRLDVPVAGHPGAADGPAQAGAHPAAAGDARPAEERDPVLDALGFDPVSQEALSARTGLGPAELGARLLELELLGEVARLPGQLFQRLGRA